LFSCSSTLRSAWIAAAIRTPSDHAMGPSRPISTGAVLRVHPGQIARRGLPLRIAVADPEAGLDDGTGFVHAAEGVAAAHPIAQAAAVAEDVQELLELAALESVDALAVGSHGLPGDRARRERLAVEL
jgi:hypothetical protein